jgi:hypothetical protein
VGAFLYFVEGRPAIGPTDLGALGLADVAKGAQLAFAGTSQGPSGKSGVIFAFAGDEPRYMPAAQTWRRAPNGLFWLGIETEHLPGPDDLARNIQYAGRYLKLNDGNEWLVPIARIFEGGTCLPTRYILGERGEAVEVMPEFVEISRRASDAFDAIYNAKAGEHVLIPDGKQLARAALGVNYRLGDAEILMLGLLGDHNNWIVIEALCDFPSLHRMREDIAKKNGAPGSQSTTPGGQESQGATSQATPTSHSSET